MESTLFNSQVSVAGLGLGAFSTTCDLIHAIKSCAQLWDHISSLDKDVRYFKALLAMQIHLLETWESDWYGLSNQSVSIGRLRLLSAHDKPIQDTLHAIRDELDKLIPVRFLERDASDANAGERMKWIMGQRNVAEASLQRVGMLLQNLFMILSLQSPHPEGRTMITLAKAEQSGTLLEIPSSARTELPPLVTQTLTLGRLKRTIDADLKKRITEFRSKIPGEALETITPLALTDEDGTGGTRSWSDDDPQIMIEWKVYDKASILQTQKGIELRGRNDNLARMLHTTSKPAELLTLPCTGYFDDIQNRRYGFLFRLPIGEAETAISLNKLLKRHSAERLPTLEQRFRIAYSLSLSLSILFGIEWLHKGIRSHNILFITQGNAVRWDRPYLCGFAYARPDRPNVPSDRVDPGEWFNVYRHPTRAGRTSRVLSGCLRYLQLRCRFVRNRDLESRLLTMEWGCDQIQKRALPRE